MKLVMIYKQLLESKISDVVLYHGTLKSFDQFDLKFFNAGSGDGGWLGLGIYLTNDYEYSETYADPDGFILECTVKLNKSYIITESIYQTRPLKLINDLEVNNSIEVTRSLKSKGYDSVILTYEDSDIESGTFFEVCVFNSTDIKINKRYEP